MKKLAIITTHPIQYNAPWFRLLTERKLIVPKVFYTWGQLKDGKKYDPGFGANIEWNIPLLDGYDYCFVNNVARQPGSHHFKGIDNPTLVQEIEGWAPDAILVFGWSFKSHLSLLRHFKGKKKILFRGDSNLLDEQPGISIKKIARRLFLRWVYNHVDAVLYVGTANKDYYIAHGLKENQLIFAPHAIDNDRFNRAGENYDRKAYGIPDSSMVFIFAGKFETKKDPQLLLGAFLQLKDASAHLFFIGNGDLDETLKAFANQQPVEVSNRIHFIGFQNQQQMPGVYKMGNVFVLPSRGPGETWGLAVNEAMACSRAILVSNKCGCAIDLVKDDINGFIFKSGDQKDLTEKLSVLAANPEKIAVMGYQSGQLIRTWSFKKICIAVEEAIQIS